MANLIETLLEVVPDGAPRKLVRGVVFVVVVAACALISASWLNAQAQDRIELRVHPLEVQLVEQTAVGEQVFNDLQDLRIQMNPKVERHDLKAIKRQALRDYQLEQIALRAAAGKTVPVQ